VTGVTYVQLRRKLLSVFQGRRCRENNDKEVAARTRAG
jgi:hypothetical protein